MGFSGLPVGDDEQIAQRSERSQSRVGSGLSADGLFWLDQPAAIVCGCVLPSQSPLLGQICVFKPSNMIWFYNVLHVHTKTIQNIETHQSIPIWAAETTHFWTAEIHPLTPGRQSCLGACQGRPVFRRYRLWPQVEGILKEFCNNDYIGIILAIPVVVMI